MKGRITGDGEKFLSGRRARSKMRNILLMVMILSWAAVVAACYDDMAGQMDKIAQVNGLVDNGGGTGSCRAGEYRCDGTSLMRCDLNFDTPDRSLQTAWIVAQDCAAGGKPNCAEWSERNESGHIVFKAECRP
jgi:hypothetical protein